MEVTRHNFREAIVTLEDALKHAKFVAIDTEFSGLARTDSVHNTPLDTPSMRYMSVREAAMEFPILQLGICVFQEPPSLDSSDSAESGPGRTRWLAHPFNFYCSPRPFYLKPGHRVPVTDRIFSMQASSVEFLARANFDFNKCFRDGIGALNGSEVSLIRAAEARMAQFPRKMVDRTTVDEKCLKYFNETTEAIKNWWNGNTVTESDRLRLPPGPTGTARRLIYEFIETEHPELQATVIGGGNCPDPPMLVVSKPSKKLRESTQESLRSRALALLDQRLENDAGMRTVLRILRQQQVPLIFHNSLADLSRLIHQFEEELPEKLNEFRCSLNLFCPKLIDTKMLVEHARITSSLFKGQVNLNDALKEILSTRKSNHEYEMSQGQERYIEAQHEPSLLHEAAFDAFLTGKLFIELVSVLCDDQERVKTILAGDLDALDVVTGQRIINQIPLSNCGSHRAIDVASTEDPDATHLFDRPNVLFVSQVFPSHLRSSEVRNVLGSISCDLNIYWRTESSFFIELLQPANESTPTKAEAIDTENRTDGEQVAHVLPASEFVVQAVRDALVGNHWNVASYRDFFQSDEKSLRKRTRDGIAKE